ATSEHPAAAQCSSRKAGAYVSGSIRLESSFPTLVYAVYRTGVSRVSIGLAPVASFTKTQACRLRQTLAVVLAIPAWRDSYRPACMQYIEPHGAMLLRPGAVQTIRAGCNRNACNRHL